MNAYAKQTEKIKQETERIRQIRLQLIADLAELDKKEEEEEK